MSEGLSYFFIQEMKKINFKIVDQLRSHTSTSVLDLDRSANRQTFNDFFPANANDFQKVVALMPSKSSPVYILQTSLLLAGIDVFAPIIVHLAYLSFQEGSFTDAFKTVLRLLKRQD